MTDYLDTPTNSLWIPGSGLVPVHVSSAQQAITEYDADLRLARNERTGDWVVLLRGPDGIEHIAFGLGMELPSADQIKAELYSRDVRRRGRKIVRDIARHRAARRKAADDAASDGAGEVAEAMTWGHQQMGTLSRPVYIPRGV